MKYLVTSTNCNSEYNAEVEWFIISLDSLRAIAKKRAETMIAFETVPVMADADAIIFSNAGANFLQNDSFDTGFAEFEDQWQEVERFGHDKWLVTGEFTAFIEKFGKLLVDLKIFRNGDVVFECFPKHADGVIVETPLLEDGFWARLQEIS